MTARKPGRPAAKLFRGSRIALQAPRPEDEREFLALMRKSVRFFRGVLNPPLTHQSYLEILERWKRDDFVGFFIVRLEDNAIVGVINIFHIIRRGLQSACVGYYMGAPYAGQGYMGDALQIVVRIAFKELKLHRLEANIQPKNLASLRVARRAGFRKEGFSPRYLKIGGRWRDHERWAILVEDWRKQQRRKRP
jgi:[ribosomal protein S5]-alanine N-acetyltransferase